MDSSPRRVTTFTSLTSALSRTSQVREHAGHHLPTRHRPHPRGARGQARAHPPPRVRRRRPHQEGRSRSYPVHARHGRRGRRRRRLRKPPRRAPWQALQALRGGRRRQDGPQGSRARQEGHPFRPEAQGCRRFHHRRFRGRARGCQLGKRDRGVRGSPRAR